MAGPSKRLGKGKNRLKFKDVSPRAEKEEQERLKKEASAKWKIAQELMHAVIDWATRKADNSIDIVSSTVGSNCHSTDCSSVGYKCSE